MKLFSYLIIAIVAIALIAGFFILGTPKEERMRRLDNIRVSNLQEIQSQVINYWQSKEILPSKLTDLKNDISGFRAPVDPETGASYEYVIIKDKKLTFELCANFITEIKSSNQKTGINAPAAAPETIPASPYDFNSANWNWEHGVGRACFERTIDPDQFPPFSKSNNNR